MGSERFFGSHMSSGTALAQNVKMNELFSPAGPASQVLYGRDKGGDMPSMVTAIIAAGRN